MRKIFSRFLSPVLSRLISTPQSTLPDYYTRSAAKQIDIRTLEPFSSLAGKVITGQRTYLYYDRLYPIFQSLVNLRRTYHTGIHIAEVGVYRGGGSYFMASVLEHFGMPEVGLHCFDTFEGHASDDISNINDNVHVHVPKKFSGTSLESVKEYLEKFDMVKLYKGRIQDNAEKVKDSIFGFVHVDVDLYEPTLFTLEFFDERLTSGGMMIVDDFDCTTCIGVRKAVEEFLKHSPDYAMYALLSAQCVLVKKK